MNNQIAEVQDPILQEVFMSGNLDPLTPALRVEYYRLMCERMKLDPISTPLQYIRLSGKLVLYAKKEAAMQVGKVHNISLTVISTEVSTVGNVSTFDVLARATAPDGTVQDDIGSVVITPNNIDNDKKKAVTQAKRRAVLAITGYGMLDESEAIGLAGSQQVVVDPNTGEIIEEGSVVPERPVQQAPKQQSQPRVVQQQAPAQQQPKDPNLPELGSEHPTEACKDHQELLRLRRSGDSFFWGCPQYRDQGCKNTRSYDQSEMTEGIAPSRDQSFDEEGFLGLPPQ